ncbi:MAG: DHH family phosphoesterase [Halobacteriota archaeon]|nr:DHH family phosphoesterase [Halobacteriota archaeon]
MAELNSASQKTKSKRSAYLILGCGSVGFSVASELKKQGRDVVVVDRDPERVKALREQNLEAFAGDVTDPKTLGKLEISNVEAAFILCSDCDVNKEVLTTIKGLSPNVHIVVRASDPVHKEALEDAGADMVLLPSNVIANAAIRYLERAESARNSKELLRVIHNVSDGKLAIITHDNPDPDAISSALALKYIASTINVEADILHHGDIGHQANRAFVNLLNIETNIIDDVKLDGYSKIALIDVAVPGANNPLPDDAKIDIIIDHHPKNGKNGKSIEAEYSDIRPNVGATSTIMTKYLQELHLPIDNKLSAALLYGIRTDTQEFKRNTCPADLTAAAFLYPLADHDTLSSLETPPMSVETLDVLGEAIRNKRIKGSYLISNAGFILDRDVIPQAADYLLNLEGISTVVVFGLSEDQIYISGRTKDIRLNIANVMSKAFGDIGSAGGHATISGAQVPLGIFSGIKDKQTLMDLSEEAIFKRFFRVVGVEKEEESTYSK